MEVVKDIAIYIVTVAFLTGLLMTAVTGSARVVKYFLGVLAAAFTLGTVIGFIVFRGLLIFLLFQIIVLLLILCFVVIAGAVVGGGVYALIHKKVSFSRLSGQELDDYLSVAEFSSREGISEQRALARIRNGFYLGGRYGGCWYVHKSELSISPQDRGGTGANS